MNPRAGDVGADPHEVDVPEPIEEPILVPVETPAPAEPVPS